MKLRTLIACVAVLTTFNVADAKLRLTDPIAAWRNASLDERLTIANVLVFIAGQGWDGADEEFFERCLDNVADVPRLEDRRITDAANGCVLIHSYSRTDAR